MFLAQSLTSDKLGNEEVNVCEENMRGKGRDADTQRRVSLVVRALLTRGKISDRDINAKMLKLVRSSNFLR
jgi:hypothetical protein